MNTDELTTQVRELGIHQEGDALGVPGRQPRVAVLTPEEETARRGFSIAHAARAVPCAADLSSVQASASQQSRFKRTEQIQRFQCPLRSSSRASASISSTSRVLPSFRAR